MVRRSPARCWPESAARLRELGRHVGCTCRASSRRRCRVNTRHWCSRALPAVKSWWCRRQHDRVGRDHAAVTATCRTSRSRAAACPTTSALRGVSPDGSTAWVPSKQDNMMRGSLRNGRISISRTRCAPSLAHRPGHRARGLASRLDLDNSSVASAAVFDQFGVVHVRGAGNQPRSRGGRRAGALGNLPLHRRPRAAGPGSFGRRAGVCTSTTSWIEPSAYSTSRGC